MKNYPDEIDALILEFDAVRMFFAEEEEEEEEASIVVSLKDVTERKQAEEALRESEERYRRITDAVTDYIFTVYIENGQVVKTVHNQACIAVTGYSAEEFAADPCLWITMVIPEDRALVEKHASRILTSKDLVTIEHRIYKKNGRVRWISNTPVPHYDFLGALISYDGLISDITEHKKAEEKLRKSETKYRQLVENLNEGIWVIDEKGKTAFVNSHMAEMLGYTVEEMLGRHLFSFMDEQGVQNAMIKLERRQQGIKEQHDFEFQRKDGTRIYTTLETGPVTDEDGNYKGAIAGVIDITNQKRVEAERKKLEAQLFQSQKMDAVGRLAGGVAHDFNNMLTIILGHAEQALQNIDPSDPLYDDLEEIQNAGKRSADLTRQLLAFARKQTILPKMLDLNNIVKGMLKMLRRLIGEDIAISWNPGNDLRQVKIDPSQIDQILTNLCINARDAISDVGKVTIETANIVFDEAYCADHAGFAPGEYVMLAVSDNGCGMDKETLINIFEPFFTTKEMGKGTGMGLSMVYGIVKQNNGFINIYSDPGFGTAVKIFLPCYEGKTDHAELKGPSEAVKGGLETIMLVEDELEILKLTKTTLERLGYTVLPANSPGEAIRLANEYAGQIDLLITDVVMPEMNGRDLAKNLLSLYPDIKRLFMSGYTAEVINHSGVLDEWVYFIQKPFSVKELDAKVREAMEKK